MKKIKVMMLMVAACLAGCSSDNEPQNQQGEAPRLMIVDVSEKPVVDGKKSAPRTNRAGEPTTTATLSRFSMNYMGNKYDFTKTGVGWSTNDWPGGVGSDVKIDFYAYTYIQGKCEFNYNGGDPYVAFTVEETVANQHDLLVAEHKQISYSEAGGHVSLTFDHACAAVRFSVWITNTLHTNLSGDLTVKSIVLKNVIKKGDYHYNTGAWDISDVNENYADYTVTNGAITVTTTPQTVPQGYLYMIPQTRAANGTEGTYLDITYNIGSGDQQATIPLPIDWEAGWLYTVNIQLGTKLIQ